MIRTLIESLSVEEATKKLISPELIKLYTSFVSHFKDNKAIKESRVPKSLINNFGPFNNPRETGIYHGSTSKKKNASSILTWTLDYDTALAFAKGDEDKVIIFSKKEFKKLFKKFVSMDAINSFLQEKGINPEEENGYFSESEIVVLS